MKKYHVFKININILNIGCTILTILIALITFFCFPDNFNQMIMIFENTTNCLMLLPIMILYFILHELLHAIGYVVHGADYKKITFGMELEKGVFYCLCKQDVTKKNILFSLMYPLVFIGILTYMIAIIFDLPMLLLLSGLNISGAIGDIMYFIFIVRLDKNIKFSELDDGTSFAILSEKDISKSYHPGLDYIDSVDTISRKDFKLIKISKLSWIVIIICLTALVLSCFSKYII